MSIPDLALIEPNLEPCEIERGTLLEVPNERIAKVYFPESGIASVVVTDATGRHIEVGPFGREGMSGLPIVLRKDSSPFQTSVQANGTAYCIRATALKEAIDQSASLHARLLSYMQAFSIQVGNTMLVNSYAHIDQRLARWLLMAHDRIDGDNLPLTHEFIAVMLGVRRAGVTEATQMLEGNGLIKATRGLVQILDRAGLEAMAGDSYGAAETEYERIFSA